MILFRSNRLQDNIARALWFIEPNESIIRDTILPNMGENLVKVKTHYSAISPGTERLVFQGLVPPSMKSVMKVPYMEGDFSFPIKYGYSLVGEIIEGHDRILGKRIHVMHPHQNLAIVQHSDIRVLPESLPDKRAALISNTETCINAIWDSGVSIGDRVLIVGFGTIGSLLAMVLDNMGYIDIDIVDINPQKLKLAKDLGFNALIPDQVELDYYDISYNTSSTQEGLQTAIDSVGQECKIIELSWHGSNSVNLQLGTSFHVKRKKIISSQVSTIPGHKKLRWDYDRRINLVLEILSDNVFDNLITGTIKFEDIATQFAQLCSGNNNNLSLLIDYR